MASSRIDALYAELDDIERQLQDTTLPHSDQQMLDRVWNDILDEIETLEAAGTRKKTVTIAPPPPKTLVTTAPLAIRVTTSWTAPLQVEAPDDEEEDDYEEEDNRAGCEFCSGCMYCEGSAPYDGADEV